VGAELYGDTSEAADLEIIGLMLAALAAAGLKEITLDLGHVGVYDAVLKSALLTPEQESTIFDALQRKSRPDLLLSLEGVNEDSANLVLGLLDLHGDASVLDRARDLFCDDANGALAAVEMLQTVADAVMAKHPQLSIYFDLAELRGYHYHTGIVFAAYVPGYGQALANGGRYNNVGEVYGRARPATGFATDLKALTALSHVPLQSRGAISKPDHAGAELDEVVARLRASGEIVINRLADRPDTRCDRELVLQDDEWVVIALNS
jgi:ATP phosphoribosyltransferase regulatory subunit